jgi:hypothetical protein
MKSLLMLLALTASPAHAVIADIYECTATVTNHAGEKVVESKSTAVGLRQGMIPDSGWVGDWQVTDTKFELSFQYDAADSDHDIELDMDVWYVLGKDHDSERAFTYGCTTHMITVGNSGQAMECAIPSDSDPYDPWDLFTKVGIDENQIPKAQAEQTTRVDLVGEFDHPTLSSLDVTCKLKETAF